MAITPLTVTIDLNPSYKKIPAVYVSQLDNNLRSLAITVQDGGVNYDVASSGYDVYVEGTKPDKHGFSYKVTDIGGTVVGSVVTVPMQTQMTCVQGMVPTEIVLKSGSDRIGSANFLLVVERAGLAEDVDVSETDIPAYIDGAQQAAAAAAQSADDAEDAKDLAVAAKDTAVSVAASIPEDYTTLSNDVDDLKSALNDISETITSKNVYNPSESVKGTLNTSGGVNDSSYITTGFIPVSDGDVLYGYYVQNGVFKDTSNLFYVVSLFDENKTFISRTGTLFSHSYIVPTNCSYIRATFQITYATYKDVVMVTKNVEATEYEEYFAPYITAVDRIARSTALNKKIIDCWGDSRIAMVAIEGTAISDYLLGLLGSDYITANYGISSQNANMVACRFGSNEVFVTFENNQIPASGNANITAFKCSVGGRAGEDFRSQSTDLSYGVKCEIAGVKGTIIRRYSTEQYFVRETDGTAVTVKPRTKIIVPNYDSKKHVCIFWAGKNDFGFNTSPRTQGIIESVESMANSLGHDKYIILGETYSVNDNYASGTVFRNMVDTINAYYASEYSNNYIDIQAELIANGLTLEGITPTSADTTNIANGFIPDSLMADTVHLNSSGREAVAKIIYAWMQEKDWI